MKIIPDTIKIFFVFGFIFLSVFTTQAQVRRGTLSNVEFRVGTSSSDIDIQNGNRYKVPKYGFNISVIYTRKLFFSDFQFQTGLIMTKKGMKQDLYSIQTNELEGEKIVTDTRITTDANYVQIPLMFGYEKYINSEFAINFNVGAYGAVGFKGTTNETGSVSTSFGSMDPIVQNISRKQNTFSSGNLKKIDYGLTGGVGIVYDVYSITVGYDWGLYNISDDNTKIFKNRNFTLAVGLRF